MCVCVCLSRDAGRSQEWGKQSEYGLAQVHKYAIQEAAAKIGSDLVSAGLRL